MSDYDYATSDPFYYGLLKQLAQEKKSNPTLAECVLWEHLKKSQLGIPFRRQHIIDCYIADFFCMPSKLVVEVDGGYHQLPEQIISDEERTKRLNQLGYKVIRFSNEEVLNDIENVLKTIKHNII